MLYQAVSEKAKRPMYSTLSGKVMFFKFWQLEKASVPIFFRFLGSVIDVSPVQYEKALLSIYSNVFGKVTLTKFDSL